MNLDKWKNWKNNLTELIDSEHVEADYLDPKDTFAPIWEQGALLPEIKEVVEKVARQFFDSLELNNNIQIKDIILTGSLAGYNWSDWSDLDLHILLDFSQFEQEDLELMRDYFKEKTKSWNKTHAIMLKGFELELYIQNSREPHHSAGIYSILSNRWLKYPVKSKIDIDYPLVKQKAAKIMEDIDDAYEFYAEHQFLQAMQSAEHLQAKLKKYRQSGLEQGGIYSIENLVFKVLRRNDYLKKLHSIRTLAYDNLNTINEEEY